MTRWLFFDRAGDRRRASLARGAATRPFDEFDVICVSRAKEAESVLDGELVQVILCDHRMAGESGVDFLKRARISWPDPIRIIISGYTESEDIIAGVNEAGIYQYITKPWERRS